MSVRFSPVTGQTYNWGTIHRSGLKYRGYSTVTSKLSFRWPNRLPTSLGILRVHSAEAPYQIMSFWPMGRSFFGGTK